MKFISMTHASVGCEGKSWWFVFRDSRLLVGFNGRGAEIPFVAELSELKLTPLRRHFIGTLDGTPCFTAQVSDDAVVPDGFHFKGLRELFDAIDDQLFAVAGRAYQIVHWDLAHQYCGECGAPTELKSDEFARLCPRCGRASYPNSEPAIIVAVRDRDRILLGRRRNHQHGMYSVLAGFVDPGETLEACVRREVKEEVGVAVKNIRYFGSQSWPFPNSLMVAFTAEYAGGEIAIDNKEIVDAQWFAADRLPTVPGKITIARHLIDWFVKNHQAAEMSGTNPESKNRPCRETPRL